MRRLFTWNPVLWCVSVTFIAGCPSAPPPPATNTWAETYGSASDDEAFAMAHTADGGFVLAGRTLNQVARSGALYADVAMVKTDANGKQQWLSVFGGAYHDEANAVQQTTDGGYILAGTTMAQVVRSAEVYSDMYLVKADSQGGGVWSRTYGGGLDDEAHAVEQTEDGGFVLAGSTLTQVARSAQTYDLDMCLVRTDASGNSLWSRTYVSGMDKEAYAVQQTADGGFILAGSTLNQVARGATVYDSDMCLVKADAAGNEAWSTSFGGSLAEAAFDVRQTADGGYVLAGYTDSSASARAMYLVKTDSAGNGQWSKTYAGSGGAPAWATSVRQTSDGGYVVAGTLGGSLAKTATSDVYIVKTDSAGNPQWTKVCGGDGAESASAVCQTTDGGYAVAGSTMSFGNGGWDFYLVKTDADGAGSSTPGS